MTVPEVILTIAMVVVMAVLLSWTTFVMYNYFTLKKRYHELRTLHEDMLKERKEKDINYSKKMLSFIRMLISQITVLKFRNFQDNHDMKKITEANIKALIQEIGVEVYNSINMDNIAFNDMLFTKDFYNKYIVDTTIILVKELLEKATPKDEN